MASPERDDQRIKENLEREVSARLEAAAADDVGLDVDVAFAYVGADHRPDSVTIACIGCGLQGQVPQDAAPPEESLVLCSDCMSRLDR
jgi:hypothetical protein